jgi:hypothetical protein
MGLDLRLKKPKFGLDLRFIHSQMNLDLALLNLRINYQLDLDLTIMNSQMCHKKLSLLGLLDGPDVCGAGPAVLLGLQTSPPGPALLRGTTLTTRTSHNQRLDSLASFFQLAAKNSS